MLTIVGQSDRQRDRRRGAGPGPARVTVRLVACDGKRHARGDRQRSRRAEELASRIFTRRIHDQIRRRAAPPRNRPGAGAPARAPGRRHDHRRLLERHDLHRRAPDAGRQRRARSALNVISTLIVEDDYHVATIHAAYVRKVRGFSVAGHASTAASARARSGAWRPRSSCSTSTSPTATGSTSCARRSRGKGHRPDFLVITAARDMAQRPRRHAARDRPLRGQAVQLRAARGTPERLPRPARHASSGSTRPSSTTSTPSTASCAGRRRCPRASPDRP